MGIQNYTAKPWRASAYIQDKLEFQEMIANIGLRLDVLKTGDFIVLDGDEDDDLAGPFATYLKAGFKDSLSLLPKKSVIHALFSPRLGISHPISENAKIFFSYGHFYKWPDATQNYREYRTMENGWRTDYLGNPRLDPPKTIQYEIGYSHNLFNLMELVSCQVNIIG